MAGAVHPARRRRFRRRGAGDTMITHSEVCTTCNGSGKSRYAIVTSDSTNPNFRVLDVQPLPCADCNGTGIRTTHIWELKDFDEVGRILREFGYQDATNA